MPKFPYNTFTEIQPNLPTCIKVDWKRAWQEYANAVINPALVLFPRVYQLETTNLCNLDCVMCPRKAMTRPLEVMSDDLFKTIVDRDLQRTKAVELFGFGEPFTDKQIGARMKYLHSQGIWVTLATNGLLLTSFADWVLDEPDYLVFDVDAVDQEQYERIRQKGSYGLMRNNLERLLKVRKKYTVLQYINIDPEKSDAFVQRYTGRADEVRVKFLDTFAGQVGQSEPQERVCCLEVFYGVSIWSNGDVVMCDRDFNSVHKLGNVKERPLEEIWADPTSLMIKVMHNSHQGEKVKLCSQCKEWRLTNLRNVPELTVNMFKGGFV